MRMPTRLQLRYWWVNLLADARAGEIAGRRLEKRTVWWAGPSPLLLPRYDIARDALVFVTSRRWWTQLGLGLICRPLRVLVRLGVWDVEPGGYYLRGRICWRPWANPRAIWALRKLHGSWREAWRWS